MARVRYRGPYPTEQLFTALLECFRHDPALDDPLRRFMEEGDVDWMPAPRRAAPAWRPASPSSLRHQIDKVVLDGVAFYRRDWQGVIRHEPRVGARGGRALICSLWALGRSLEDRLTLDRSGEVQSGPPGPRSDSAGAAAARAGPGPRRAHRPRERPRAGGLASRRDARV